MGPFFNKMPPLHRRLYVAARYVLGHTPIYRDVLSFPDDVFVVSYPKSGNTWMRFLLANLLHPEIPLTFANVEQIAPSVYENYDYKIRRAPRPRVIKTHEPYRPHYRRVIHIVRDPRDVALSFYHRLTAVNRFNPDNTVEDFIRTKFVTGTVSHLGNWAENVGSWIGAREGTPDYIMLRYRDIKDDTVAALRKIVNLLGVEADDQQLKHAAEASSADNMRKLEKETGHKWKTLKNGTFVRAAKAGGWRTALTPTAARLIGDAFGPMMQRLGYDPNELPHADNDAPNPTQDQQPTQEVA
jgi:estrone sulfotransferase